MAFNPSSTIYLCNVPFDNSYKNQIYFENATQQQSYFTSKVRKTFSEYLTVRETTPDGSMRSTAKVNANIDTLRALGVNYMYYQNANHSTRFFYAFITKLVYVNESTTKIIFETDVYQTWRFDVTLKPSFVVREHSKTDYIGENRTPESFNFNEYDNENALVFDTLDKWGYLVTASECLEGNYAGYLITGIFQGLFFYYIPNDDGMTNLLNELLETGGDCIVSITVMPHFSVSTYEFDESIEGYQILTNSASPSTMSFAISKDLSTITFGNYKPKNNKLYTSPYLKLCVSNNNGGFIEYLVENFTNNENANTAAREFHFSLKGDISVNPSVMLYPHYYNGVADNVDESITISGFPQCSTNTDTFKLWLAKNQFGLALETAGNVSQIVGGLALAVGSGGTAGAIGGTQILSGVNGILNTVNSVNQASKQPNKANTGNANNNLLTAMKKNTFRFYYQKIKKCYAQMIDEFFTMYGYQTNRLKTPNVSSRPYFNYVQTIDANIVGGIPNDDMEKLKHMYNNGVTLWKHNATVGDYNVDNTP